MEGNPEKSDASDSTNQGRSSPGPGPSICPIPPNQGGQGVIRQCNTELLRQQVELMTNELQVIREAIKEQEVDMKNEIERKKATIAMLEKETADLNEEIQKMLKVIKILQPLVTDKASELSSMYESHQIEKERTRKVIEDLRNAAARERAMSIDMDGEVAEMMKTLHEDQDPQGYLINLEKEKKELQQQIQRYKASNIGGGGGNPPHSHQSCGTST